jgi:hypothetical protein
MSQIKYRFIENLPAITPYLTNSSITVGDSPLAVLGKLQAQVTAASKVFFQNTAGAPATQSAADATNNYLVYTVNAGVFTPYVWIP